MPSRMLREGILSSRAVNALSEEAELFYRHLMSIVDDFGRCEADLDLLQVRLFPRQLDRWPLSRVSRALTDVSTMRTDDGHVLVTLYADNRNKKYLEIYNFDQRLRAKHSKCPPPEACLPVTCAADDRHVPVICRPESESESESESEEKENRKGSVPDFVCERLAAHPMPSGGFICESVVCDQIQRGNLDMDAFRAGHDAWIAWWTDNPKTAPGPCKFEKFVSEGWWKKAPPTNGKASPAGTRYRQIHYDANGEPLDA